MEYTIYELLFFLFCYSFIGWCGETLFVAVRRGHFIIAVCLVFPSAFLTVL